MDKMRMAACGIDCSACDSYKVTMYNDSKAAEGLVDWYREAKWIGEDEGADAVMRKNPLCRGCWNSTDDCFFRCGCHHSRDFRVCCTEKGIAHCGQCGAFPCQPYTDFVGDIERHKEAMEHLKSL